MGAMLALLGLAGCLTVKVTAPVVCLPQSVYTATQEKAFGDALAALPSDNALIPFVMDAIAMRKANEACIASNSPKH